MSTVGLPIKCKAMVARAPKVPMVEEEITVMPPKAGEVRVKVIANACEFRKLEIRRKNEWDVSNESFVFLRSDLIRFNSIHNISIIHIYTTIIIIIIIIYLLTEVLHRSFF
jgi:hypothetical protein